MLGSTCFRAIRDYFYLSYGLPTNDYLNYFFNKSPYSLARVPTIEAPLRGEILNRDSLVEYASSLAEQHHGQVAPSRRGSPKLFSRFEENNQLLEVCYQELISAAQNRESLTSGAEWLLDNYHIIEAQVRNIRRDFPRSYYHSLPKLLNGDYRDYPRVYHFAVELVSRTDANIDTELLNRFIGGYQAVSVLASGELWAIPIMLRITLIENLRRLAVASLAEKNQRIIADRFISQITTQENFSGTEILLLLAQQLKTEPTFLSSSAAIITRRLREQGSKSGLALRLLEEWFRERGQDVEDLARAEQSAQAANQVSISNCVTSLKRFSSLNWQDWVESVSAVNKILLDDPAKVYGSSDFPTRDTCRHSVERYARAMQCSEVEIATKVVALAQQVSADLHLSELEDQVPEQRFGHIGYYLAGKGREQFEQQIKFKVPAWTRCKRYFKQRAFAIYSSSILFLTFLFSLELLFYGLASGGSLFELVLLLALFVLPISELASNIVQWVSSHLVKPARISKLDFEHGVPRSCRTVVTVQMIFNDLDTISEHIICASV